MTLSAAEGMRGPLQPGGLPTVTTPRHPHSYPQDPEPLKGGGLEPWGAGMHGLLLHAHPAPDKPAGLWRNQGLALALRPSRGRPRWGMCAPAPDPGPSLGEASGAKAPPGRAQPPCSPKTGPPGSRGRRGGWEPLPAGSHLASGAKEVVAWRGQGPVWNPLCPSSLLPLQLRGRGPSHLHPGRGARGRRGRKRRQASKGAVLRVVLSASIRAELP